jgi:serine/threonine protein kinase
MIRVMAASASPSGRVLGRYTLYDAIAAGGMATVHFGRLLGPAGFARTVAIKRLHPQFARDPEFVSMFLDEARLAARIRHPNVVPTLDVVSLEEELFLVMDYVQGESLGRLMKAAKAQGKLVPIPYAVAIVTGALQGLHAAHEARGEQGEPLGIVHRDVSPQNILVGVDGVPRVLDFGVAKAAGRSQVTRAGQVKGKMAYIAPEQLRGTGTDRRTDVYAAGVVLWEVLTGGRLFTGENDVEVFGRVLAGRADPPSTVVEGIPHALDAIVLRALSIDPEQRFSTAREMARALQTAVPLVPTAEVGEWVEETVAQVLAARMQTVVRIETESSASSQPNPDRTAPQPVAATLPSERSTSGIASVRPASAATYATPAPPAPPTPPPSPTLADATAISVGSVSEQWIRRVNESRRTVLVLVASGVAALLAIILIVRVLTASRPDAAVAPPASAAASVSPTTAVSPAQPVAATTETSLSDSASATSFPPAPPPQVKVAATGAPVSSSPPAGPPRGRPGVVPRPTANSLDGVLDSRK